MNVQIPRLVIAGLSGDSGKTIVSLSILAWLRKQDRKACAFKKGPDYIDSAWLEAISGETCRNLDTYLTNSENVYERFMTHSAGYDIAIIEGNRGIYDGKDVDGIHSTSELSKILKAPVVLVVSAKKVTRTLAAQINGCVSFSKDTNIVGVILNKVAGKHHEEILTASIKKYCKIPVLGVIPRLDKNQWKLIPNRHLGLITPSEYKWNEDFKDQLAELAQKYLDMGCLTDAAKTAPVLKATTKKWASAKPVKVKIGYFKDSVFTFYYPENLEALSAHGAKLVPVSSMDDVSVGDVDAFYIGGGFPETQAERLTRNKLMMDSVKSSAQEGMPIYAECGGLIYLSESILVKGKKYPMAGLFPTKLTMTYKPAGHGYSRVRIDRPNPFFEIADEIRGHEFHYSQLLTDPLDVASCMHVETGTGLGKKRDGLIYKNTMACYTHIHADSAKNWASKFVECARSYKAIKKTSTLQKAQV
ncbi:cobyrinate a,c-diamide synthase [Elusimicrobiota bacterium]